MQLLSDPAAVRNSGVTQQSSGIRPSTVSPIPFFHSNTHLDRSLEILCETAWDTAPKATLLAARKEMLKLLVIDSSELDVSNGAASGNGAGSEDGNGPGCSKRQPNDELASYEALVRDAGTMHCIAYLSKNIFLSIV